MALLKKLLTFLAVILVIGGVLGLMIYLATNKEVLLEISEEINSWYI